MKKLIFIAILIVLFGSMIANAQTKKPKTGFSSGPIWLEKAVFYQIYPQSYQDSNGDGIGDLQGITNRLDYIASLGINAIWLNPIFESPFFDAGYDVSDFYKIAPRYGSLKDLKILLAQAHKRGIKVCLDLVAGHTSDQHPWFKASAQQKTNAFSDRYIWTQSKTIQPEKFVAGDYSRNGTYQKNFFDSQPALNYGYANPNPKHKWEQSTNAPGPQKMKKELQNIIDYWLRLGVDGFRVDMASSLIKNDKDLKQTYKLWGQIRRWLDKTHPQAALLSEWSNPEQAIKAGFMIDFMIHFNIPGFPSLFFNKESYLSPSDSAYFDLEGKGSANEFIKNYTFQTNRVSDNGYVSVPTGNHDINRPNSSSRNTNAQLKVVMCFIMTLKGVPFVYYGDEIGMKYLPGLPNKEGSVLPAEYGAGNRAGTRTPMQWNSSANAGFSSAAPAMLYLPTDTSQNFANVAQQETDPNSLLNFSRQLIKLRKTIPALGNKAQIVFLNTKSQAYPLAYLRNLGKQEYLIVINPAGRPADLIVNKSDFKSLTPVLVENISVEKRGQNMAITASGVSYGIFKVNK